jgi:hypothetical protein
MNPCAKFTTIEELNAAMNGWLLGSLWGTQPASGAPTWFDECQQILRTAFGVFCLARMPETPPRPWPIAGTQPPEVLAELQAIARRIDMWAAQVEDYLDCVRRRSAPHCQATTAAHAAALRNETRRLRRALVVPPPAPTLPSTCEAFVAWSTQLFEWSKAFATFERAVFDCVATDRGLLMSAELDVDAYRDAPRQPRQISPVPWPPWEDIIDA